jgi:uncharacterized protein (TIGR02452 family)
LSALLGACLESTRHYQPEDIATLRAQTAQRSSATAVTTFAVTPETTLQGAARLILHGGYQRVGVLHFASARNPGGGFLSGAQAQEESLARSSALYWSLLRCPEFYTFHRSLDTCLYSDRMIYSPRCSVVRDDAGHWLLAPYLVDSITSAAPNAGAVMRHEPHNRTQIGPTLRAAWPRGSIWETLWARTVRDSRLHASAQRLQRVRHHLCATPLARL